MGGRGGSSGLFTGSRTPKIQEFSDGTQGYKISWKELEKILDKKYPKESSGNIHKDWYVNNWQKDGKDRSYLTFRTYKNGKRSEIDLGYYDNVSNSYIVTNNYKVIHDVVSGDEIKPKIKKSGRYR